jgi:hypothetical protein
MAGPRLRPGGVGEYFSPTGAVREVDTSTCNHCGSITEIPSRREMMNHVEFCRGCGKLVCLKCAGQGCVTQEMIADAIEAEYRRTQIRKMLGG